MVDANATTQTFVLEAEQELRVETARDGTRASNSWRGRGGGGIFGAEIAKHQSVACGKGRKLAVFTYHGATVEVIGEVEIAYVAGETPMVSSPTRTRCFTSRDSPAASNAEDEQREGPRVMCVGPTDVGKARCARFCVITPRAWGRRLYVDLDLGQGAVTGVPGMICAAPIDAQIDVEEGIPLEMPWRTFTVI